MKRIKQLLWLLVGLGVLGIAVIIGTALAIIGPLLALAASGLFFGFMVLMVVREVFLHHRLTRQMQKTHVQAPQHKL